VSHSALTDLRSRFGEQVQENLLLAPYTSARIGGPADILLTARNADELADMVLACRECELPFIVLGGGSNVLVSDRGVRQVVILNRAKDVKFELDEKQPRVRAESGTISSNLAHRAATHGLSGLEWAGSVPGTIGGAVYGNAGAFGGDMAGNLLWAEVLTSAGRERWPVEKFGYGYRTSVLKRGETQAIILSAELRLQHSTREAAQAALQQFAERRKNTQPPGASMGSMFKNPSGDYAGRLIEAAGLKGVRIGKVQISPVHANFFLTDSQATASDVAKLVEQTRSVVAEKFGVQLELEVEFIGEWS
jgi:UDP-N-acetylmuramate dehydrogenase